ncbi:coiled-coil domain-containing protein 81 isoform X3 [Equus caballus]|uniref:coiled-coil domain-containing protein 81 isoform X3 n=1 Tax=Equus caballus TaxID=9796 RepID=UPI000C9E6BB2|nr:coiled-coil domain-containing protein 81 isoform X3 [Equus caballus]
MLDTIIPSVQDLARQVLPTLPSLSQEDVNWVKLLKTTQLATPGGKKAVDLQTCSALIFPLHCALEIEVSTIWGNVSEFVERQLSLRKGVQIPGLGTFTFMRQKLEVGNNKFILIQRPVFIMAEKLVQIHGLKQNKVYTPGDIPIVPLNFVMISLEGPFNRDIVEGCVKETLLFLSRSISIKENVEFTFKGIGVLVIRDGKVKMRFYKDFLCTMDGSGALAKALANRPGTVDSVLSSRETWEKRPRSVLVFPSLSSPDYLKNDDEMNPRISPAPACQDHNKAGQEMCYVCLQRAQRNCPLYYGEERRRREIEDERLIQQYQMLKDQEALFKEQLKSLASREQNKKNAAYNLGVAEAIRIHKNEKPEFYKSFLFDKRPLSPEINAFKQEEYSQSLLKQVDNRREKQIKQRQNRELMDRLEQVQLTEELAAQRAKYIKDKIEETWCYKRALDAQIKNKAPQLPMFEPDSFEPIFGNNKCNLMVEKQMREQNYMKHQLEAAASHKRRAILHQLVDQKRDLQMLQRAQKEHLADRNAELERVNRINQSLQEDWERSAAMKRQRDLEEKAFERASDKLFLLDQCEKYRRCRQCQRCTSNVGKSNLWPLNKSLHGSRLFV